MLEAWIDGAKRRPNHKGERATCRDCGGELHAVIPIQNERHWRHRGGDCDAWSEPETAWHVGWKEKFEPNEREVTLRDTQLNTFHRADVLCSQPSGRKVVLELQHSSISEEERKAREDFYKKDDRLMFWLLHIFNDRSSSRRFSFEMSLAYNKCFEFRNRTFGHMEWMGRSSQFIDRWKQSNAHVFLSCGGWVFYLASRAACADIVSSQGKGNFALSKPIAEETFVEIVRGVSKS